MLLDGTLWYLLDGNFAMFSSQRDFRRALLHEVFFFNKQPEIFQVCVKGGR